MATVVKKKRLHELDSYDGDKSAAVALISVDEKEYKLPISQLGGDSNKPEVVVDASGAAAIINPAEGTSFYVELTEPHTTLSIYPVPDDFPANTRFDIVITLKQGTGSNKVEWPGMVKWPNGFIPPLSYIQGKEDVFVLSATDGGYAWKGASYGLGY